MAWPDWMDSWALVQAGPPGSIFKLTISHALKLPVEIVDADKNWNCDDYNC